MLERVAFDRYSFQKRKRINEFYELCKFYADIWNGVPGTKKFTPQRFMRDCKKNRRAYELAQIDYHEVMGMHPKHDYKERARLLFGRLKARKDQLNQP